MKFSEDDLAFVAIHRRAEVLRRIGILERYLADPSPDAASRSAAEIGVGPAQFSNLARSWATSRRPEDMAGAGRPRQPRRQISRDQRLAIEDAVAELPGATLEDVSERARRIADRRGIPMPARATVIRHAAAFRAGRLPGDFDASRADLVVEPCVVDIPIEGATPGASMPMAILVMDPAVPAVIGVELLRDGPTAAGTAAAILDALTYDGSGERSDGRNPPTDRFTIHFDRLQDPGWAALAAALEASGLGVQGVTRTAVTTADFATRLFGKNLAGVPLPPRRGRGRSIARPARLERGEAPVGLEEATAMLRARCRRAAAGSEVPAKLGPGRRGEAGRLLTSFIAEATS